MRWFDLAGAIGKGVSQGTGDLREMQNEALRREMQKQQMALQQQAIEDNQHRLDTRNKLKGIRRAGETTYQDDFKEAGAGSEQARELERQTKDFGQEGATATKAALGGQGPAKGRKVTRGDSMRDASDVLMGQGEYERANAASGMATQADESDMKAQIMAKRRELWPMVKQDPVGFLIDYAPHWYKKMVPDGHSAVTQSTPKGVQLTVYNDKTNQVVRSELIPKEQVQAAAMEIFHGMTEFELGNISAEEFLRQWERGIKKQEVGARQTTANAAMLNAESGAATDRMRRETGDFGQMDYRRMQGRAALERVGLERQQLDREKFGQPVQLGVNSDGEPVFGYLSSGKDGARFNTIDMPPGVTPTNRGRGVPEVDPELKKQAYLELREAGPDPKMASAVRRKYPEVFGPDPVLEALKNAPPPPKKGGNGGNTPAAKEAEKKGISKPPNTVAGRTPPPEIVVNGIPSKLPPIDRERKPVTVERREK